jgi:hypothetical protein
MIAGLLVNAGNEMAANIDAALAPPARLGAKFNNDRGTNFRLLKQTEICRIKRPLRRIDGQP